MSEKLKELGFITPSLAKAQAVENLSEPIGTRTRTLSVLTPKDLVRINLFDILEVVTAWDSISRFRDSELNSRCSLSRKGVRGRDDLVAICQDQQEDKGVLDTFKEKISNFFRSGN